MGQDLGCELISQEQVYELTWQLAETIRNSGFRPQVVIAVARGGFVPARYLCDFLSLSAMTSVKVQHYAPGAHKEQRAWIRYPLSGEIAGQDVLLVDDVNDTGDTLLATLDHLRGFDPRRVRTAVLHEKVTTKQKADYRVTEVRDWHWIVYPWAVFEDVGAFLARMEPRPANVVEAGERLRLEYGIQIGETLIDRIYRSLSD